MKLYSDSELPAHGDVVAAREFIAPYLPPTPMIRAHFLSQQLGFDYWVKCENAQPVGAFKVRGGVNLLGNLDESVKQRGVVTASTGNHGQSIAFAGGLFGIPVTIYAPERNANPTKMEAMRALGADVRLFGRDFDEARGEVERVAAVENRRYVHSGNEPFLIAGVGTIGLEIADFLPDVEVIIVPVGGGSGACGVALAVKEQRPEVRIVGVQSASAPACREAWKSGRLEVEYAMDTEHEGLATRVPFAMTMQLMWELLDDFLLVTDEEINAAIPLLARHTRQLAEGAGAASTAAAVKLQEQLQGKKVAGVLSGGNLPLQRLAGLLAGDESSSGTAAPDAS